MQIIVSVEVNENPDGNIRGCACAISRLKIRIPELRSGMATPAMLPATFHSNHLVGRRTQGMLPQERLPTTMSYSPARSISDGNNPTG